MSVPAGSYDTLAALAAAAAADQAPADSAQLLTQTSQIAWETQKVQPPTSLYVTINDRLQIKWWNISGNTPALEVSGRLLEPDGTIKYIAFTIPIGSLDLADTFPIQLAEGFLLDVTVTCSTAGIVRGMLFVQVALLRGATSFPVVAQVLTQDYVWTSSIAQWPGTPVRSSLEGPGWFENWLVIPIPGADFNFYVQSNTRARIMSAIAVLTTSAVAANRFARMVLTDDAGNDLFVAETPFAQVASLTRQYCWAPGVAFVAPVNNTALSPLPDPTVLEPNWRLRSSTVNMQAGDGWGQVRIATETWVEP